MIDYTKHSVWLSSEPCATPKDNTGVYILPPESSFFYLGGGASWSYNCNYNASVTGIYSRGTAGAQFIDSASGAVSTISVSTTRVQEPDYDNSSANYCSNAKVLELMRQMKNGQQLNQGAYILRLYNQSFSGKTGYNGKSFGSGAYVDFPVFLDTYNASIDIDSPNTMRLTCKFIKRVGRAGQNIGATEEGD